MSPSETTQRNPVSLRAVLVGLLGVLLICVAAPFSDLVLKNSPLIGGALPVGVVLLLVSFVVVVNGPLHRFAPRLAFSPGEVSVMLAMTLVACCLPTRGLMQMWPATVIGPWQHAPASGEWDAVVRMETLADSPALAKRKPEELQQLRERVASQGLPDWFFPHATGDRASTADPVVQWFAARIPDDAATRLNDPYTSIAKAWVPTSLGWGVFFGALGLAVLGLSLICAKQWSDNERIPFPLAQVPLALIEAPKPGDWLNATMRSRSFLVAIAMVLLWRGTVVLNAYFKEYVPDISLGYNLRAMFADEPLKFVDQRLTLQTIYPLVIAVMFFVSSRVSFSLWAFVLLMQIPTVWLGMARSDIGPYRSPINLGALVAFAGMILWSGRHQYVRVLRLMVSPERVTDRGDVRYFLHYRTAGWMALLGTVIAVAWLVNATMPLLPAVLFVLMLLTIWMAMANVLAQSGLLVANTLAVPHDWFSRGWLNAGGLQNLPTFNPGDVKTQFFAQQVGAMWAYNSDHLSAYASHGAKAVQSAHPGAEFSRWGGRGVVVALVLALVVGFVASLASTLWVEYSHQYTLDRTRDVVNKEVTEAKWTMEHASRTAQRGLDERSTPPNVWAWVSVGGAATAVLAFCNLRFAWWPLHPIGLLMCFSFPVNRVSVSIFIGWLVQALVVRFGGAKLYRDARPFFIGIIVGEVLASGVLSVVNACLYAGGIEYIPVNLLPNSQY